MSHESSAVGSGAGSGLAVREGAGTERCGAFGTGFVLKVLLRGMGW